MVSLRSFFHWMPDVQKRKRVGDADANRATPTPTAPPPTDYHENALAFQITDAATNGPASRTRHATAKVGAAALPASSPPSTTTIHFAGDSVAMTTTTTSPTRNFSVLHTSAHTNNFTSDMHRMDLDDFDVACVGFGGGSTGTTSHMPQAPQHGLPQPTTATTATDAAAAHGLDPQLPWRCAYNADGASAAGPDFEGAEWAPVVQDRHGRRGVHAPAHVTSSGTSSGLGTPSAGGVGKGAAGGEGEGKLKNLFVIGRQECRILAARAEWH